MLTAITLASTCRVMLGLQSIFYWAGLGRRALFIFIARYASRWRPTGDHQHCLPA